jgi:hypothetical protein
MSSRIFRAAVLAALVLAAAAVDAQVNLSNGLVAQYRLAGNATDTGSQAQNGTVFGSVTFPTGVAGKFNPVASDSTGYIDAPPALNRDTSFTVSAWVKPTYIVTSNTDASTIVFEREASGGDACNNGAVSAGNFGIQLQSGQYSFQLSTLSGGVCTARNLLTTAAPVLNTWSHVVTTYDKVAGVARIHVNGVVQGQASVGTSLRTVANARLKISRNSSSANQAFHGDMADIRIYDRVVTADEIAALAAMTPQVPVEPNPGPVSYYPFNGNANDLGSNGNAGVVSGTAAFTDGAYLTLNPLAANETGWMDAAPAINRDTSMSFAVWLRSTSFTGDRAVFYERRADRSDACGANAAGNFALEIHTGERFAFPASTIAGGVCTWSRAFSQTTVVANQWYHVSGTYDKSTGTKRIYVNGNLETTAAVGTQLRTDANARLQVSRNNSISPFLGFHGDLDDLRFYDRALTASEVASLAGARPGSSNGACGTANNVAVTTAPTTNLCATGTATPVTGTGPWSWTCNGSGGGTNAGCSAPSNAPPECAASTVATIAHVDLTASMTVANALNYGTFRQTFNVTCANGRFGVVRLPGVLLGAIVGTGGAYALVQSACATKPVQTIASPPATSAQISTAMATKNNQSALLADPLVGPLAAWVCQ